MKAGLGREVVVYVNGTNKEDIAKKLMVLATIDALSSRGIDLKKATLDGDTDDITKTIVNDEVEKLVKDLLK